MRGLTAFVVALVASCALAVSGATAAPPIILKATFSHVTTESAILEAEINPGGNPTKYRFEYGPADCSSNPCTKVPSPKEGEIKTGEVPVLVSAQIEGLTPKTTYHFRVVASNKENKGGVESKDRTLTTYLPPQIFDPCPNDLLREESPSGNLPDCRAYEQASPIEKNGDDALGMVLSSKASLDGDAVSFLTTTGIPGAEGIQDVPTWLARKGPEGWSTQGLLPPASAGPQAFVRGWSPDFSQVFDWARRDPGTGPPKSAAFLAISTADRSQAEVVPYGELEDSELAGSNPDGSLIAFESQSKLLPAAIAGKSNVYAWKRAGNVSRLASVLNDGTSPNAEGSFAGSYNWIGTPAPALPGASTLAFGGSAGGQYTQDQGAVSADGKDVYFTTTPGGQLYVRLNAAEEQSPLDPEGNCTDPAKACTLHVSGSQRTAPDPAGTRPAAFMAASADGSTAYFTSPEKLTDDAKTGPEVEPPTIARAEIDGDPKQLGFLLQKAKGVAFAGEFIYWASPEEDAIGRAKLNGTKDATEVEKKFIKDLDNPQWVAVDAEHIYWTSPGELDPEGKPQDGKGMIGRAKLGPGGAEAIEEDFIEGASNPQGVAANATHVYWANAGSETGTRTIGRAKLGPSGVEAMDPSFIPVGSQNETPHGVTVDATRVYWTSQGAQETNYVVSRNLEGESSSEKFLSDGTGTDAQGIVVDASFVYWSRQKGNTIGQVSLDLAPLSAEREFIQGAGHPLGLALDATHLYWTANQNFPPNPGNDLYRFEISTGELSDLTKDAPGVNGAEVKGVLGTSADGSYVYFVANDVLASGATPGDCKGFLRGSGGEFSGQCSLYLAHGDDPIVFIARLAASSDAMNWIPYGLTVSVQRTSRVSPDGSTVLFRRGIELYRYRVGEPGPTCVSCNPSEASPIGIPSLGSIALSLITPKDEAAARLSRNLSADGNRVFFETTDALLPADTNGEEGCPEVSASGGFGFPSCLDAYMWEAQGTGTCNRDEQGGGCLSLLSTGKSERPSFFIDASTAGDDAFIATRSQLVGQDQDQLYDVYDVSVEGGLASQNEILQGPCTSLEACHEAALPPPGSESAATPGFTGPPDPQIKRKADRCPKGRRRVRSKGRVRCLKKPAKQRSKSRNAKKAGRRSR